MNYRKIFKWVATEDPADLNNHMKEQGIEFPEDYKDIFDYGIDITFMVNEADSTLKIIAINNQDIEPIELQ